MSRKKLIWLKTRTGRIRKLERVDYEKSMKGRKEDKWRKKRTRGEKIRSRTRFSENSAKKDHCSRIPCS
jgi:hypothetical protein